MTKRLGMVAAIIISYVLSAAAVQAGDGFEVSLLRSTPREIVLEFTLEDYTLKHVEKGGATYTEVLFPGKVTTKKKGFAELPFVHASVALPSSGDLRISVEPGSATEIPLTYPMLPSRGVIYRNQKPADIPYEMAPSSRTGRWYPEKVATASEPYILRDVRGTDIHVYPFRTHGAKNILKVYHSVIVTLSTGSGEGANALSSPMRSVAPEMEAIYRDMFINYVPATRSIGEAGELLVIHTPRDASAIAPYVAWKRQKGITVHTLEVSAGSLVKNSISQFYASHPSLLYVQLVGDWADIKSELGTSANAPTDPMLGCVAGSDYYPDLIIGRFSAQSASDVTVQVNKTVGYEKNPQLSGSWYPTALGIGSGEGSGNGDDGEADYQHVDVIKEYKLLPSTYTTVNEVYQSGSASSVSGYVNGGLSLINYTGHGSHTSWGTTGFSNSYISSLTNGSQLPVIISVACVNGEFHNGGDCFAESWLKKSGGGAVATVMATINQPWTPPMRGQDYMNDLLVGGYDYTTNPGSGTSTTEGRSTFGSLVFNGLILMYAESATSSDLDTLKTWTIFGDASLQVRTEAPLSLSLSATSAQANTPFDCVVTSGGSPVPGALVALYQQGTLFKAITDASGAVSISHTITAGEYTLAVTGKNLETKFYTRNMGGSANQPPEASFSTAVTNLTATFTDTSQDSDGSIDSRQWDFGDGTSSTAINPAHTYAAAGSYLVTLTVTDDDGASDQGTASVTVTTPDTVPVLQNGVAVTNLSAAQGDWLYYKIIIPAGVSSLTMEISGGSGDGDLYTLFGAKPDTSTYDCRPYLWGNNETCTVSTPASGTYYMGIRGYSAFSGLSLTASFN
ncbi:C25 family cysteine peptidase [Desulfoluna spongiiphila]|uniref:C25 family cysteine peptidase n=1 Tax=Desulfoluna spongiiphila TaxID=419481 RepID=UPI001258A770|nr:C25 family cysteine peptidase [Desulfoluna spongiiphila]VVS90968.1 gingipain [Desulfoluna spongiiphila]